MAALWCVESIVLSYKLSEPLIISAYSTHSPANPVVSSIPLKSLNWTPVFTFALSRAVPDADTLLKQWSMCTGSSTDKLSPRLRNNKLVAQSLIIKKQWVKCRSSLVHIMLFILSYLSKWFFESFNKCAKEAALRANNIRLHTKLLLHIPVLGVFFACVLHLSTTQNLALPSIPPAILDSCTVHEPNHPATNTKRNNALVRLEGWPSHCSSSACRPGRILGCWGFHRAGNLAEEFWSESC